MKRIAKRWSAWALSAALVAGLLPAQALAVGEGSLPSVGGAGAADVLDSDAGATATDVYVDVVDDFQITGHTDSFDAQSVHDALEQTEGRIWAQVAGGSGVARATWTVRDASGAVQRVFEAMPDAEGRCALPLSADDGLSALRLAAPCSYECAFSATDRSNVTVGTTVAFRVLAPGESSEYGQKTVYQHHAQTFDGVATYAEPSATGLFHEFVTQLDAAAAQPGSPVHDNLMRIASEHAAAQQYEGAYAMLAARQLEARLSIPREGDPVPFAGALSVVVPLAPDADADEDVRAGDMVTVFSYGADGQAREPLLCTVRADRTGQLYVAFEVTELGAFGVAKYHSADQVTVIARAVGNGFINYEGRYAWPRQGSVRYVFTPVEGCRIAAVTAETMAGPIEVPALAAQLGYYDLDLAQVPSSVDQVRLTAVFEPLPAEPEPGDPERVVRKLTTEVAEGSGAVYVNGQLSQGGPFEVWEHDTVWLAFQPNLPSQRVKAAEVIFEGAEAPVPLAVYGQSAVLRGMEADALVRVSFDSEMAPEPLAHTVTLSVAGGADGHGSIDTAYGEAPTVQAEREVADGGTVSFTLHPQEGWRVYIIMEGAAELSGYLASSASGLTFAMPDVHRDHRIEVTFAKIADLVPGDEHVTIQAEGTVDAGSVRAKPPVVTPPAVVVPKGGGYTFAVIPADADSVLSSAWVKAAGASAWTDITVQVAEAWTLWPEEFEGAVGTGYYALALEDVQVDTFVRVSFRDATEDDEVRPPTPVRNVSIDVRGAGGMVFPNTMDGVPLKVPVGKSVQVTIVRQNGHHLSEIVAAEEGEPIGLDGTRAAGLPAQAAESGDVLGGGTTYTIPDRTSDQAYTFVFAEDPHGGGPDEPGPDGPDDPDKPGPGGPDGPGPDGTDPAAKVTVTPVVVPGADNRKHGSISPGTPVHVAKGDSLVFSLRPDAGWRVSRVEANGVVLAEAAISSIELRDIQADTELRVMFTQKTQADAVPPIGRPIHTLRSLAAAGKTLAQTGDTALVAFTGLAATACATAGVAVLIAARRHEREGQAR